jgi:CobQ-like glutamine amidotransferase family enzyme
VLGGDVLRIVTVYPDLLGTYGDRGNGLVLRRRAALRGLAVALTEARSDEPLPVGDLYCIGGGEDGPQQLATARLRDDGTLASAVRDGAVVLAVCAGLQVLGRSFAVGPGERADGIGLLPLETVASLAPRAVGEVLVDSSRFGLLTGFENHAGRTVRDGGSEALGVVRSGVGNGDGTDGVVTGRLVGTYLHGPVLARNPTLADQLLAMAVGAGELEPLEPGPPDVLHAERVAAAGGRASR